MIELRPQAADGLSALSKAERYVLEHGVMPPHGSGVGGNVAAFRLAYPLRNLQACWSKVREVFLAEWVQEHPGERPYAWWAVDAPRARVDRGHGLDLDGPEPLRHLSGSGRPVGVSPEHLARARGLAPFADIDPDDPPVVESEAAYLRRHRLLLPGEARRLAKGAFEPTALGEDVDDGE